MPHYREILQGELNKRVAKNKRYTLRAFANFLELNSGSLSSILKGKRALPRTHWQLCCEKLGLTESDKSHFLESLVQEFKLESLAFQENRPEKSKLTLVPDSKVAILSEWEYAAVLTLMDIESFELSVPAIQKHLDVKEMRAEAIFKQLIISDLVQHKNGRWQKTFEHFKTTEDIQSRALVLGHLNELELARKKLSEVPINEREFSSLTFAGSSQDVRKMKLWLRKMVDEFDQKFEKKKGDQAFLFALQLFPVTKKVKK